MKKYNIGKALREIRLEKGITKVEVGARLGTCPQNVGSAESKDVDITFTTIIKFADALGVTPLEVVMRAAKCTEAVDFKAEAEKALYNVLMKKLERTMKTLWINESN